MTVSPPTPPLKALLEQRRDAHESDHGDSGPFKIDAYCRLCDSKWPCPDRVALDAALASLAEVAALVAAIRDTDVHHSDPLMAIDRAYEHAVAALALLEGPPHESETT